MSIAFNQEDNEEETANKQKKISQVLLEEGTTTETEQKVETMPAGIKKLSVTLSVEFHLMQN